MLILFYTIQQVIPNICTREIFDTNFPMYYTGVRDGKIEKDGKNKSQHLGFLSHNILGLATLKVNLKTLALIEAEKSVIENLTGEKEKCTNKGNGKYHGGWFSLTQYNKSYPTIVPNFKILDAVVPEKSLTQISLCITLEWEMEKKEKEGKN